jgi:hypothetical protein
MPGRTNPAGKIFDSLFHIIDARFPFVPNQGYLSDKIRPGRFRAEARPPRPAARGAG